MASPLFTFMHDGSTPSSGTPVNSDNPIEFGDIEAGTATPAVKIDIWNDRGGGNESDTATSVRLLVLASPDAIEEFLLGTDENALQSMIEARSCTAYNTPADAQEAWTPISKTSGLEMGNMPSNSKRGIEIRMKVPSDANPQEAVQRFQLRIAFA